MLPYQDTVARRYPPVVVWVVPVPFAASRSAISRWRSDMAPVQTCPDCHSPRIQWLEDPNRYTNVTYFRCEGCRCVWSIHKFGSDREPKIISLPKRDIRAG